MKNKKEDTKLYMGIIGLAKTTAGMNCEDEDYQEVKQYFRYPGELLERMEEQGFTSTWDYISVMKGLSRIGKYHTDGTFIGSQLEDFLKRAKEKALKENNLILLYQVLAFSYLEAEPATLTGEDISLLLTTAEKNSLEDLFEFLLLFFEEKRTRYWKENKTDETALIKKILAIKKDEIMSVSEMPVLENKSFYMTAISFFHDLKISILRNYPGTNFEDVFGKNLGQILLAFSALYEEPVKTKNEKFLKNLGYTEMDILNLNVGIWFLNDEPTYLQDLSAIKWWRLLKKWFQELFHQDAEISFADCLRTFVREYFDSKKMPQKIDGENIIREFLLKGFQPGVPNVRNSYLLFDLLTMKISDNYRYDVYNAQNQVPRWDELNGTHKLSASRKEEEEWLRGLVKYLYPEGIKKESDYGSTLPVLPKRLVQIYAYVLQEYIADQKKLEGKEPVLNDIFDQDVKEFLYQQASYFTAEQLHPLFESGYLDFSEFMRINSRKSGEYLEKMDRPYLLSYLKDFCESRNWMFTGKEADYLEKAMGDSWPISIAYHKTDKPVLFHKFSEEECETMLGLICELITRIPDICPLSDLMAGFISNEQSRKIIGEEICAKWYKALEARNYNALNVLRQDYLSEKEYKAYVQKKKELEEEKRKNKERENLKAIKEKLDAELNGLSDAERLDILSKKMPSYVSGYSKDLTVIAILDAYRNLSAMIPVTKKVFRKCINFFLECYDSDYITRKEFMDFASKLMEETKNE